MDFLVDIQENLDPVDAGGHLWDLTYELEDLLNRKVGLITERSLKNSYFINELNETKFPKLLNDVLICLENIENYLGDKKIFDDYSTNFLLQDAVERNLITIR